MPVFDFSSTPENEKKQDPVCTYTTFRSNEGSASAEKPILILDNSSEKWNHHAVGVFGNQSKRTNFEFKEEGSSAYADILQIDARFVSLIRWLGENHINVRLSGENRNDGYAVFLTSRFQIFSFIHQKGSSHRRSPQQAITFSGLQLIHVFPNGIASFFLQKTEFPIVREA